MLAWTLALVANAWSAPPAHIPHDDPEPWEDAWSAIIDGPPGCWEVVGKASWRYEGGRFGGIAGDSVFVGRLQDGEWRDIIHRSLGEKQRRRKETRHVYPHDETRFAPLVGKRRPSLLGEQDDGQQIIAAMAESWGGRTMTLWSRWEDDAEAVVLRRSLSLGTSGDEAEMKVHFPQGELYPLRMKIDFPERFRLPDRRLVTIRDAHAEIRAQQVGGMVFPESETFSFEARVLGFKATGAQTITYQSFRACGLVNEDETPSVTD